MSASEEFAERIFGSTLAAMDLFSMHLGDRLGYYRALAEEPATARQLAERTGTDARYAREWLEQQAVTGIVEVLDETDDADARRFWLPRRPETLRRYATEAGFAEIEVLPIETDFWRFYRLRR